MPLTAATMTMLMPEAISAYSIAVAPDVSRRNSDANFARRRNANSAVWIPRRSRVPFYNLKVKDFPDPKRRREQMLKAGADLFQEPFRFR